MLIFVKLRIVFSFSLGRQLKNRAIDNTFASTFNEIPLHIRSTLNVKLFKTHSKRFHSTFSRLNVALLFFLSKRFFLAYSGKHLYQMRLIPIKNIYNILYNILYNYNIIYNIIYNIYIIYIYIFFKYSLYIYIYKEYLKN